MCHRQKRSKLAVELLYERLCYRGLCFYEVFIIRQFEDIGFVLAQILVNGGHPEIASGSGLHFGRKLVDLRIFDKNLFVAIKT